MEWRMKKDSSPAPSPFNTRSAFSFFPLLSYFVSFLLLPVFISISICPFLLKSKTNLFELPNYFHLSPLISFWTFCGFQFVGKLFFFFTKSCWRSNIPILIDKKKWKGSIFLISKHLEGVNFFGLIKFGRGQFFWFFFSLRQTHLSVTEILMPVIICGKHCKNCECCSASLLICW